VIAKAKERGAKELSLIVYEDNRPALNLFNNLDLKKIIPEMGRQEEKEKSSTGNRRVLLCKSI